MDYLGKVEMLTNRDVTTFERNNLFMHMEHFRALLFQLMKHGTNTLQVAFIFLFNLEHDYLFWMQFEWN
jgi:hypothetical protein